MQPKRLFQDKGERFSVFILAAGEKMAGLIEKKRLKSE